jgi:hypothetical protein
VAFRLRLDEAAVVAVDNSAMQPSSMRHFDPMRQRQAPMALAPLVIAGVQTPRAKGFDSARALRRAAGKAPTFNIQAGSIAALGFGRLPADAHRHAAAMAFRGRTIQNVDRVRTYKRDSLQIALFAKC